MQAVSWFIIIFLYFIVRIHWHILGVLNLNGKIFPAVMNFWPFIATELPYLVLHKIFINFPQKLATGLFIMTVLLFEH